ncbi:polycystin-1 [Aplochiton taeniatus]
MDLGKAGQWRKVDLSLPSMDSYLAGLPVMTGVYAGSVLHPLSTAPDPGQHIVEMMVFPGLWFSHAGQVVSVELLVQPSPVSSLARMQILRPYCSPHHHLVPPGCSSLLNPFSCCSAVPLCNTTGGCSRGQYWCHLLEACVPVTSPCSPYHSSALARARSYSLPPRYTAIPPFYHLVADLPLRVEPSAEPRHVSLALPEREIMVYPDDVLAIQHSRSYGPFLQCRDGGTALNSPWCQSYLSLRGAEWGGWWEGGLSSPLRGGQWVDGVVCDLRVQYEDTLRGYSPSTQHGELSTFTHPETTTPPDIQVLSTPPATTLSPVSGLCIVHPQPERDNQIHLPTSIPSVIVVKILSGQSAFSSWSTPVLQSGVPFFPSCPDEVPQSWPGCERESPDTWFSSVTVVLPSEGEDTVTVRVENAVSSQSVSVKLCVHEPVIGLSVSPRENLRMLVDVAQVFTAKVASGSSVKYTWVVDDLVQFAYEGESYSVLLKKPADYKLRLTASNPISSQTQEVLLTAEVLTPLAELEFFSVREFTAVAATRLYYFRVKVDISLGITFRWEFGDGRGQVNHTYPAPSESTEGLVGEGETRVFVQDSVSHAYLQPGEYSLKVQVFNRYDSAEKATTIKVRPPLTHLLLSSSPAVPLVGQTFLLEASPQPSPYGILYTWDFGDDSKEVQGPRGKVSHVVGVAGIYNITVCGNNSLSALTAWVAVEVRERVTGLRLGYDGPNQWNSVTAITGEVATGTGLTWDFDFGDGSRKTGLLDSSASHVYKAPGNYTVKVSVSNSVSRASQNINVEIHKLAINGVLTSEAVVTGEETCFSVVVYPEQPSGYLFTWFNPSSSNLSTTQNALCFAFEEEGKQEVSVMARNKVSYKIAKASVAVQAPVSNLFVAHGGPSNELTVNAATTFWVDSFMGTNVSVQWNFGDGSALEHNLNVSHVFTSAGRFTVTATACNAVSWVSATLEVNLLLPVSDLLLRMSQPFAVVGEETVLTAVSSASDSSTNYCWSMDGMAIANQETYQFRYVFPKAYLFHVRVTAKNLVSQREAAILVEAFERLEELQIECLNVTALKYISTREEVPCTASLKSGSNVTYHWLVDQTGKDQITGDGESFQFIAESPGNTSVKLTASNRLGVSTAQLLLTAIERVSQAVIRTPSDVVAVEQVVNISVAVVSGSDLYYLWYVNSDLSPLQTDRPVLLHTFRTSGSCFVRVSVQNPLGHSNATKHITVQAEARDTDFQIDKSTHPFYIQSHTPVVFHGFVHNGTDLHWNWSMTTNSKSPAVLGKYQSITYTFTDAGTYKVSLNVSNRISWQTVSHRVTAQDAIRGLTLNISNSPICSEDPVVFTPAITRGSNVSFTLTFDEGQPPYGLIEGSFTTSRLSVGTHPVTVKAWNQVSSSELTSAIEVVEPVRGLRLVDCCTAALEALEEIRFQGEVASGYPTNYSWVLHLEGFPPLQATGQEVMVSLPGSGSLLVAVVASNGVCSETLRKEVVLQRPVKVVKLLLPSTGIFTGYAVALSAAVDSGSHLRYIWDFGDSTEGALTITSSDTVDHTYFTSGSYNIRVTAFNNVSRVSAQLLVDVGELQCSLPKASLVQGQSVIYRSRPTYFEASIDDQGCTAYKTSYLWEILRGPDCEDVSDDLVMIDSGSLPMKNTSGHHIVHPVTLSSMVDVSSPLLALPKQALEVAQYCLVFTFSLQGTPLSLHRRTTVSVIHSPLVAVVKGGSHRLWPSHNDLSLDGSESHDPDMEPGLEDQLHYHWVMAIEYKWTVEDETGMTLDLDKIATSTGGLSPDLVVRPGVLKEGLGYTFKLNISQPARGRWGSASLVLLPYHPPHGGVCTLSPDAHLRLLETVVTYNCSGWQEGDSNATQLIYSFQVASCQPTGPACPLLTLYRGTRSTFGTLVPLGSPGPDRDLSIISVTLSVESQKGAKVVALNRTLTVVRPVERYVASQWLRNKSRTELWAILQHGNRQELIPYTIALSSQLNQIKPDDSEQELRERREIRGNMSRALASLSVSSLQEADQISSALAQSTAVPGELVCEGCQETILEAVGKMIHVLEEQTGLGDSRGVDTGRNILQVIGSSLAAVSESTAPSSPNSSHTSPLTSASEVALSALSYAGSLMRSLMRLRAPSEEPLVLSAPQISTAGFHGSPSELLCTDDAPGRRSNQSHITTLPSFSRDNSASWHACQFLIPSSLSATLRRQSSNVVQILLGMERGSESNPLLSTADPPISTSLAAMEFTTPQGQPIAIHSLEPHRAIRVTLGTMWPADGTGSADEGRRGATGVNVTLPTEGWLNFTVNAVEGLTGNAGLFICFNLSLASGGDPVEFGYVRIEMTSSQSDLPVFKASLVRELNLSLSSQTAFIEETIFLSPLLNRSAQPLSVNLSCSVSGGPVQTSMLVFSSLCQYFSLRERRWRSDGLRPLEGSTLRTAHCLTQHLTMFGASLFVHPEAVVLLPPSGGPVRNVLVGIVCGGLVLIHLLVSLIAHKVDHLESLRLSQVPLCGPQGRYQYRVLVKTGWRHGAGTTAHVGVSLHGVTKSGSRHLQREGAFRRGALDQFHLETDHALGEVWKIRLWHDNTGLDPSWYVQQVAVWDVQTDHLFFFLVEDWLSLDDERTGSVEREVLASCPEELSQFRRVLSSQLLFGMMERHLWLSLWERPSHSRFTRGQRVTCCALLLHLYLALGALWYGAVGTDGHSAAVSARLLLTAETVAVGMTITILVFPLQCLLCFLFRKTHNQVAVDILVPPSPVCQSVELDVCLGQSKLSCPPFLSLPDSSGIDGDSPSSLLRSKAFDSRVLAFWNASNLAQEEPCSKKETMGMWPSCDSLQEPSGSSWALTTDPGPSAGSWGPPSLGPTRLLKRKKALTKHRLASPESPDTSISPPGLARATSPSSILDSPLPLHATLTTPAAMALGSSHKHDQQPTALTLSEENLLRSIATDHGVSSDSGLCSSGSASSLSHIQSSSCSSWSGLSVDSPEAAIPKPSPPSAGSLYGNGLYKCPSSMSLYSVASTFLPSPSPESTRTPSPTRIGVARGRPSWLLPPWALRVIYPLVVVVLGACLAVVGLYGSLFPSSVVLMWLLSALSALLTSALLLEPLKVCVLALVHTALWRPVDPEVEDQLGLDCTVSRAVEGDQGGKVRPPCGYGLLQAKGEARKVKALRSLMKHYVVQLLFLLLVLLVNYQGAVEESQARLLHAAVRQSLRAAATPRATDNLTSLTRWSHVWHWMDHILVPHLHQKPNLRLLGPPRLQYTHSPRDMRTVLLGNSSATTRQLILDLRVAQKSAAPLRAMAIDFTHYHRESSVFVCVSVRLERLLTPTLFHSLSVSPLLIPPSSPGPDLQIALMHRPHLDTFIELHSTVLLARASSQLAAVLLTLLVLKLLATLRMVRRWVLIIRVLQRAWREMAAVALLLVLVLLLASHTGPLLFSRSVEGFQSVGQASVSALSLLRGRLVLRRLCRAHTILGPVYSILLLGTGFWLLARLFGAVLIRTYRAMRKEMFCPAMEPQDYEMVEFFIKRLKLWMGLTKAKEFRHRVKFEGMQAPPSRSSQDSRLSVLSPLSSPLSSSRPLSSALSTGSEDSAASELVPDVQSYLDRLLPCVDGLLSGFDRVNQLAEDVCGLEVKLQEAETRRRQRRNRDNALFTRTRSSYSESALLQTQPSRDTHQSEAVRPGHVSSGLGWCASPRPPGAGRFPRRRAWHSGCSHSADVAQRAPQAPGGEVEEGGGASIIARPRSEEGERRPVSEGVPVKRKAWISEGTDTEVD